MTYQQKVRPLPLLQLDDFNRLAPENRETLRLTLSRLEKSRVRTRRGKRRGLFRICLALHLFTVQQVFEFLDQYALDFFYSFQPGSAIYEDWLSLGTHGFSPHVVARIRHDCKPQWHWRRDQNLMVIREVDDQVGDWPPVRVPVSEIELYEEGPRRVIHRATAKKAILAREDDSEIVVDWFFNIFRSGYEFDTTLRFIEPGAHMLYAPDDYQNIVDSDRQLFEETSNQVKNMIYTHSPNFHPDVYSIIFDFLLPPQITVPRKSRNK